MATRVAGWKRPGLGRGTRIAAGAVAIVLPIAIHLAVRYAGGVLDVVTRLNQRPVRTLDDPTAGPVVVRGAIEGESRATPTGAQAVAFVAWVDHTYTTSGGSGNRRREETRRVCTIRHFGWTGLRDGDTRVALAAPAHVTILEPSTLVTPVPGTTLLLMQETRGEPPAALDAHEACRSKGPGTRSYGEIAVRAGDSVVVSGCRGPEGLSACGDAADAVVSHCGGSPAAPSLCPTPQQGVAAVVGQWSRLVRIAAGVGAVVSAVVVAVFAVAQLLLQRRERRHRHAELR